MQHAPQITLKVIILFFERAILDRLNGGNKLKLMQELRNANNELELTLHNDPLLVFGQLSV